MKENLEVSLARVLAHEGGYVNHPKDPGGATNRGVTQRVYDAYRDRKKLARRSVRAINADEVAEIYTRQYWNAVRGDELPTGLDYAMFDYAVNSGPRRAAQDLQRELGVTVDGIIGQVTLAAVSKQDIVSLVERLCARRMKFLRSLKHWKTFGKGWTRRVMGEEMGTQTGDTGVVDVAVRMMAEEAVPMPVQSAPGKAEEAPRESVVESKTVQAAALQVASGLGTGITALSALDGVAQIALVGLAAVVVVAGMFIFRERIRSWADGWR